MDIRTKLALALVSVALLSMLSLGGFAYRLSSKLLQEISERQLDALAETKQQDIIGLVEAWRNDVRLIGSRTQLRIRLRDFQRDNDPDAATDIERIVTDAQRSAPTIRRIAIFDPDGNAVAIAGSANAAPAATQDDGNREPRFAGVSLADGTPEVVFRSLISVDDDVIGSLEVVIDASEVDDLAHNYRGLGETGETLIFARRPDGGLLLLHGLRHADDSAQATAELPAYLSAVFSTNPAAVMTDVEDYRGERVWAATRYIDDVDWGLAVKIDTREETARARTLRANLIDLGLALAAFAIVGGTLLGFYLARPIRNLARVIERVRQGETSVRADASAEDEVGLLAETINSYLDHVAPRNSDAGPDD